MILYGDLTKLEPLDDGSIRVEGVASTPARDGAGESVDPEAIRRALPAYMAFPAIREMHQPRAAGAALHAEVDEEGATRIVARVVDPTAVRKVRAGVYKGFSIGGKVLGRDPADPTRITEVRLDEISLVDRPCNPEAVIDLWKGTPSPLAAPPRAPTNEEVRAEAERMAKAAGRPGRRNDYVAAARAKLLAAAENNEPAPAAPAPKPPPPSSEVPGEGRGPERGADPEGAADLGSDLRRDARVESGPDAALVKLAGERDALQARVDALAAEVERLRSAPLPPRAAVSPLAKAVGRGDGADPRSPDAFADALAALPPGERAHLIMKAALARPIAL